MALRSFEKNSASLIKLKGTSSYAANVRPPFLFSFLLIFLIHACLHAASLRVLGCDLPEGGGAALVPIALQVEAGEDVSAIQFDLRFDPKVFAIDRVEAGAAAIEANKGVSSYIVSEGKQRIIVAGMNQNVLKAGQIALLHLSIPATTAGGSYVIDLENDLLSSPIGTKIAVLSQAGRLCIGQGSSAAAASGAVAPIPEKSAGKLPLLISLLLIGFSGFAAWFFLGKQKKTPPPRKKRRKR